jgi:hypothetical protein
MPVFEIEHGGKTYEVEAPDINAALSGFQGFSGGQKSPPETQAPAGHSFDLNLSAADKAAVEAQNSAILTPAKADTSGALGGILATAGGMMEGLPVVGPALRGGVNRVTAGISTVAGKAPSYDAALESVNQITAQAKADHPYLDMGGQAVGGVVGTLPLMAAAPAAFGMGNGSLLARSLMSGATGAAMGGADAVVRSEGDPASVGLGIVGGGTFGALGPGLGQLGGRAINIVAQGLANRRAPVPGMSNAAANMAVDDFSNAGGRSAIDARMRELGPEAMLLDASPSHLGSAQGLGVRPETREIITNPLRARNDTTNARIRTDLDANLGPAPIPSQVEAGLRASRDALHPEYRRVLAGAAPVNPASLAAALEQTAAVERGPAQRAAMQVRQMLNSVDDPSALDNNPATLLNIREAIDGIMGTEADTNALRILGDARRAVDAELATAVPGIKDVDAQFQELARQSGGLERGAHVLDTGRTATRPQEFAQELTEAAQPQGTLVGPSATPLRIRQGARAELDRVIGTKANDLLAVRQQVMTDGDWNPQKLAQLFGEDEAANIMRSVDREIAFRDAYNKVVENSQTAMRSTSADRFAVRGEGPSPAAANAGMIPLAGAVGGVPGAALATGAKVGAAGISKAANLIGAADDISRNQQLARALILQSGPDLDVVLNALGRRASLAGSGERAGQVTDRLVNALLQSQSGRVAQETPRLFGY